MKPILFDKNATDFTTNGIGRLNPTECIVAEIRNGAYEAEITLPRDDKYCSLIEDGSIIAMKVSNGSIQRFKVYEIEKTLDDEIEVKCQHISYDLSYIPVGPYTASTAINAIQGINSHSLINNPFTFNSDVVSGATFNPIVPASARSYLGGMDGSILDVYGGEYEFDNTSVYLYQNRGTDSGVTIRWGKNITELEDEVTSEDTVDGMVPYWTDGTLVVLGDILTVQGSAGKKIVTENVSSEVALEEGQEMPTKAQVNAAGQLELAKKVTAAEETITVEYYQNPDISRVQLCDYVTVIYEPYNISVKLKVVSTKWDVLAEKYKEVELGKYKSFSQTITSMATAIDNINYSNGITTIRLERTEEGLISEVARAEREERALSSSIVQTAEYIQSRVARSQKEWDTTGYNIQNYGYDNPTTDPDPTEHSGEYYLNQTNGYLYYSNGTAWTYVKAFDSIQASLHTEITQTDSQIRLDVSQEIDDDIDDYDRTVNGYLALYLAKNEYNEVVSMIEAASDYIQFTASTMFEVASPNFTVTHTGLIAAVNAVLNDAVYFNAFNPSTGEYDDPMGYIGVVTYGLGSGFGMRNNANTVGVVMPSGTSYDWLWMGADNKSICYTGDTLQPWSSGVDLGSTYHRWDYVVCDNISCANPPWSSSDKRMKDTHGTIDKVRDFYMALKPLQYTFKEGVDFENPENMHYGLIAQDVLKTYKKCYNSDKQGIVKKQKIIDEGTIKVIGEDEKYVINYDELHAYHIAMIQELRAEVDALKAEIKALKEGDKR